MTKLLLFWLCLSGCALTATSQTLSFSCTVYFEHNSSQLTPLQQHWLDSFIQSVKTKTIIGSTLDAWCNESGTSELNLRLSEKRAWRVKQYLATHGIDTTRLESTAHGELKGSNTDSLSRKVTWQVTYAAPTPAPIAKPPAPVKPDTTLSDTILEVGKTIVLKNINFEGGTANLLPQSKPALEELINLLQKNPSVKIEIGGHVCCYNDMPLSVMRAKRIYDILISNGIESSRLTYKGYSNTKPIAVDSDETERTKNRRVEIKILSL
ncbi:MAG: OmpA family protein [Bacteroidia bacterium]|nr:OmpA family protein [Bacteroidia bacterium]